jgi:hypothetical protein
MKTLEEIIKGLPPELQQEVETSCTSCWRNGLESLKASLNSIEKKLSKTCATNIPL